MTEKEMYDRIHKNRKLGYIEEIPAWDFIEDDGRTLEEHQIEDINNIKKSQLSDLEKAKDQIEGGLADKLSIQQIAKKHGVSVKSIKKQIKMGKKVEMEHTDDPDKAKEIARDHISEFHDYYTRLAKMEDEAKKENKEDE